MKAAPAVRILEEGFGFGFDFLMGAAVWPVWVLDFGLAFKALLTHDMRRDMSPRLVGASVLALVRPVARS